MAKPEKIKTVFLTGATGYIGQYFLRELLNHDYHVVASTSSLKRLEENRDKFPKWFNDEQITWVEASFNDSKTHDKEYWKDFFQKHKIDAVLNSAGICYQTPDNTFENVNYKAAAAMMDAAAETDTLQHLTHISTVTAGKQFQNHLETGEKLDANTYTGSNALAELRLHNNPAVREKTTVVRPITVYNPTQPEREGHFAYLAGFDQQVVLGSGAQELQPIHVADVAKSASFFSKPESKGKTYTAVGPEIITVGDWMKIVSRSRNQEWDPIHIPPVMADIISETLSAFPELQLGSMNTTILKVFKDRDPDLGGHYDEIDHRPYMQAVGLKSLRTIRDSYHVDTTFKGKPNVSALLNVLAAQPEALDFMEQKIKEHQKQFPEGMAGALLTALKELRQKGRIQPATSVLLAQITQTAQKGRSEHA